MPTGFEGVRQASQQIAERGASFKDDDILYLKLPKSGDSARVRFLEQGGEEGSKKIHWCWAHQLPPRGKQKWGDDTPCLDQDGSGNPCPGCEAGLQRSFKGFISCIWRDAPVYGKNSEGRTDWNNIVDKKDQIAVWERGIRQFEELDGKDATYKGLRSRDFIVTRRGEGTSTIYTIDPADPDGGPQKMTEADEKLEASKPDLQALITPMSYDRMKELIGAGGGNTAPMGNGPASTSAGEINPFMAANQS